MSSTSTLTGTQQRRRNVAPKQDPQPVGKTTTAPPPAVKKSSSWKWWLMAILSFIVGGWAFHFMYDQPPGMDGYDAIRARILANPLGWAHVGGGGLAMVLGPFQFLRSLRRTGKPGQGSPRFSAHSIIGRISSVACIASAIGSVDIIKNSDLYEFGKWGFIALGTSWFISATMGWAAMWLPGGKQNIDGHKRWMTRNFALTYAAVMLRWQFPLMIILGMEVKLALSWSGWMCWVPNILFVELFVL